MSDQLEDRLEHNLAAQAQALPDLPNLDSSAQSLHPPVSTRRSWSGIATVSLAVAAVLILVGGPVWLLNRAPGGTAPAEPDGTPTTVPTMEWSRSEFDSDGWNLGHIASTSLGTVVIGHSRQGSEATGWFSEDGVEWIEIDAFDGGTRIRDLSAGSFGFLASGLRLAGTEPTTTTLGDGPRAPPPTSTIWYSPDGLVWTETAVPLPPVEERLSDIVDHYVRPASGNSHVMVVAGDELDESGANPIIDGEQVIPSRPLVWWSEDGSSWQLVDEPAWDEATSTMAVAATRDLVAVVIAFGGESPYSTMWTSSDGRNWAQVHQFEPGLFCDIYGSTDGFVAACNDGGFRFSVDGSEWEQSHLSLADHRVGLVTGSEHGFAAALMPSGTDPRESDMSQAETVIYSSLDGRQWEPVSEPDTFESGFAPIGISWSGRRLVVIGNRFGPGTILDQIDSIVSETWLGEPPN